MRILSRITKKPRRLPYEALFSEFGSAFQGDLSRMVIPYRAITQPPKPLHAVELTNSYRAEAGHSKFREERRRRGACGSEWGDLSAEWLGTAKQASQEVSDTLRGSFSAIRSHPVRSTPGSLEPQQTSLRAEFAETISMQISLGRFRSFPAPARSESGP